MTGRDVIAPAVPRDLVLRSPPNWTATIFFAVLGVLHLSIAMSAFFSQRWEGYMSLILGPSFLLVAAVCAATRSEVAILPGQRRLRLSNGIGRVALQRHIPFSDIRGVRLTFTGASSYPNSRIELLCDNEDIECPPTRIPRQQALCLAMLMNVRLIKVTPDNIEEPLDPVEPTGRL
jgi:hypothetical protein